MEQKQKKQKSKTEGVSIDAVELKRLMEILEAIEEQNEDLAIKLLKDFNEATKHLGQLILNHDHNLSHTEWEKQCREAKAKVDAVIQQIEQYA